MLKRMNAGFVAFAVLIALPLSGAAQPKAKAESALLKKHIQEELLATEILDAKIKLSKEKKLPARLKTLAGIRENINQELKKITPQNISGKEKLQFALTGLKEYLGHIPQKGFFLKKCKSYKNRMIVSFSPQNDFPTEGEAPLEAREALDILALVCGNPKLAKLPSGN